MTTKGFFFQFEIIINELAFSASFEYLCHGSKAIRNMLFLSVRVRADVYRRQILMYY